MNIGKWFLSFNDFRTQDFTFIIKACNACVRTERAFGKLFFTPGIYMCNAFYCEGKSERPLR